MITSNGKLVVKRFHARQIAQIGGSLALGVSAAAPALNDVRLGFEVLRVPIDSVSLDSASDRMVFKVSVPPRQISKAYEIGIWSSPDLTASGTSLGALADNNVNLWTNGTLTSSNARAHTNAVQINYSANGTTNAQLSGFYEDWSVYKDVDSLAFAYYATTNLSSLRVRLGTDANNYFEFLLPAPVANSYNVARLARSGAVKTGSPDWAALSYLAIRPSATAAGGGSIFFDGIRIDPNSLGDSNLLVARSVLSTPHTFDQEIPSDVEYSLGVTVA